LIFSLSPGNRGDAPCGRELLSALGPTEACGMIMDRAYEGNATQKLCLDLGYTPVVPPNPNRLKPWAYDKELYKKRNEVERLFRRLKGFRRVFTRYDKLDSMFLAFVVFALIMIALNSVYRT
jgi:transposase